MGGNQNTTIPDLMIEPTTIVKTKDKNNQYVNNNVNKINNNLRQPKHNIEQQTSDNNLKQNTIDQQIKIMKITYTQSKNQHKHLEYMGMQYLIKL